MNSTLRPKLPDFVSIVIPGYNEEKRIFPTLKALSGFCEDNFEMYEIIFVDDGSTDKTPAIVKGFSSAPCLRVIHIAKNQGKGYAVRQGMLSARGRYRFFTDTDLPYGLGCFLSAIKVFDSYGCDMVVGARKPPQSCDTSGLSRIRRTGGSIFSAIANRLLKIDIRDTQCGFKGFTDDTARRIFARCIVDRYASDVEIFVLARHLNLNIRQVPVTLVRSQYSKIRLMRDPFVMLADTLRLHLRHRKTP